MGALVAMLPPVFAASIYVVNTDAVLLGFHVKEQAWLPIGGKLAPGELPLHAAMREAEEEIGRAPFFPLSPTGLAGAPLGFIGYHEHTARHSGRTHLVFNFVATLGLRSIVPCPEFEVMCWCTEERVEQRRGRMPPNVYDLAVAVLALKLDTDLPRESARGSGA